MAEEGIRAFDLARRSHSWRNYEPEEFIEAAQNSGKTKVREELRTVESGRFYEMLRAGHKFFAPLDPDERRDWANQNPDMMAWIGVWGYLEDLIPFREFHDVDIPER